MRRRRRQAGIEWDAQTVFWPRSSVAEIAGRDSNLWMLADDVAMEIWGHLHRLSKRDEAKGEKSMFLEGCSEEVADLVTDAVPDRREYRDSLVEAVREFATMIARELVLEGGVDYELQIGRQPSDETERPAAVALRYVPRGSLVHIGRACFQVIPEGAEGQGSPSRVVPVSAERIARFMPPPVRRRCLDRVRASLPLTGASQREWMEQVAVGQADEAFGAVKRTYDVAIARVTSETGWNARGLFSDHTADFHWIVRELRWKRFCIEVRDHIIATLAHVFARAGKIFGENPKLVVRNLPSLQDVEEAERRLKAGPTRFDILLKPFLHESE